MYMANLIEAETFSGHSNTLKVLKKYKILTYFEIVGETHLLPKSPVVVHIYFISFELVHYSRSLTKLNCELKYFFTPT